MIMISKGLAIGIAALVGLGLAAAGASAAPADRRNGKKREPVRPTSVQEEVAAAVATRDPAKMRAKAAELDKRGYHEAAQSLRDEAERLEQGARQTPSDPTGKTIDVRKGECWKVTATTDVTWSSAASEQLRSLMAPIASLLELTGMGTLRPVATFCYSRDAQITLDKPVKLGAITVTIKDAELVERAKGLPAEPRKDEPRREEPRREDRTYTVQSSDRRGPWGLAQEWMGDGNRGLRELKAVNPSHAKKWDANTGWFAGLRINIPKSWPSRPTREEPRRDEPRELPAEDPQRVRAQELTTHLRALGGLAGRYKEDRELVKAFQAAEGLSGVDGMYGAGTAIVILERYGIIPSVPLYWSRDAARARQQKAEFSRRVRAVASSDPGRSAEYEALLRDTERS